MPENLYRGNPKEETVVTLRGYDEVRQDLFLDVDGIQEGSRIVSVGEGFSDFAQTLQHETHTRVLAIDPVYGYAHPQDGVELASQKIENAGVGRINRLEQVVVKPFPPGKLPEFAAASVYDLSFIPDGAIDLVLANRVLEHVDASKAIPELVRIVRPDGEVRLGTPSIIYHHASKDELFLGMVQRDDEGYRSEVPFGNERALVAYLEAHPELQIYVFTYKEAAHHRSRGLLMVIRQDGQLPKLVTEAPVGRNAQRPTLYRVASVEQGKIQLERV